MKHLRLIVPARHGTTRTTTPTFRLIHSKASVALRPITPTSEEHTP